MIKPVCILFEIETDLHLTPFISHSRMKQCRGMHLGSTIHEQCGNPTGSAAELKPAIPESI